MSNSIIPYYVEKELSFSVSTQLAELPEELQREFLSEYRSRSKNLVISYLLHFMLPAHYIYLDKIVTQLLFWITFGGFGFWWFIDIFRMPSLIKNRNKEIAEECLRHVVHRFKGKQKATQSAPSLTSNVPQARQLSVPPYDPMRPTIESLQLGYLTDYNFKTWQAVGEVQYDWSSGTSEREFKLSAGGETLFLNIYREAMYVYCHIGSLVNLYSIDANLDSYIGQHSNPPTTIQQGDLIFYRDRRLDGNAFDKAQSGRVNRVVAWDYYDQSRRFRLRIEQSGKMQFKVLLSQVANEIDFTDILPMG